MDPLPILASMVALAAAAPALARLLGRAAGYPLAAATLALTAGLAANAPAVIDGERVSNSIPWLPSAQIRLSVAIDGLSLVFALLVLGVGGLVFAYSARYLSAREPAGRYYSLLALFAASMLGLVLAGDAILLFVCWELTSVTSFLLIGGDGSDTARAAARRVFLVTGLGGLALLAALVLAWTVAGTTELSELVAHPAVRSGGIGATVLALVLLGAFTKSAQVPFHFWLPDAMVAPTPVSAYLHSATMVTAGVFLLARFSPALASAEPWSDVVVLVGLATAVTGALLALRQHDLKLLLAHSTVSQLGLMVALVGIGTGAAIAAAVVLVVGQALYKVALFMVVGIVDHEEGTRDIRRLSGLGRAMPGAAIVAGVAVASMVGLPPFLGFVAKEGVFAAFVDAPVGWVPGLGGALALAASVLTFAYGARFFHGSFAGPPTRARRRADPWFLGPAALAAFVGLLVGVVVGALDPLVGSAAGSALGRGGSGLEPGLALWHGITPELGLSLTAVVLGLFLFLKRREVEAAVAPIRAPVTGPSAFEAAHHGVERLGRAVGRPFLSRVPAVHAGWVTAGVVGLAAAAWVSGAASGLGSPARSLAADRVVAVLVALAAAGVALARERVAAVALLGVVGFLVATLYVLLGAPDLAITQLLVETLTVTMVVLVFRRLPRTFRAVLTARRVAGLVGGLVVGTTAGIGTYLFTGRRPPSDVARYYLEAGPADAGGQNVVNTILVDFRALDTLGEITVLGVAAVGIAALVRNVDDAPPASQIVRMAERVLVPAILLLAAYLFLRGHDAPGGGFIAGLVAGGALVLRFLGQGAPGIERSRPSSARRLLAVGLFLAIGIGAAGFAMGGEFLRTAVWSWSLPGAGSMKVASSLVFDAGVFLIVLSLVVTILRRFGGEVS
ncbi:MAG TPA: hydrogen gas-evolving membrane-bound hydrogenase subunit E [Actinomycetota bacterium]|nr:hydrogen gas-evolving membrane-bound hydrogenase subunit E [Actinomycetota bacterium]